jgi:hypothetical protein
LLKKASSVILKERFDAAQRSVSTLLNEGAATEQSHFLNEILHPDRKRRGSE